MTAPPRRRRNFRTRNLPSIVCDYLDTYGAATSTQLHDRVTDRHPQVTLKTLRRTLLRLVDDGYVEVARKVVVSTGEGTEWSPWNTNGYPATALEVNVYRLVPGVDWMPV